jgi:hypothetical protein
LRASANPSGVGETGFFLAASSGDILGSVDPGFSCVEFALAYKTAQLANRIALRTKTVLRIFSSYRVSRPSERVRLEFDQILRPGIADGKD